MDPYAVLGLKYGASEDEIKSKFRQMARTFHPDVSKHPQAAEIFKSINSAYRAALIDRPTYTHTQQSKSTVSKSKSTKWKGLKEDLKLFRILKKPQNQEAYSIRFPQSIIDKKTRIFFMIGDFEFSLFFEEDIELPTTLKANTRIGEVLINISEGFD